MESCSILSAISLRRAANRIASLVVALTLLLLCAGSPSASTFTVNTTTDSDDGSCTSTTCSLRDALGAAFTAGGTNTINFASDLSGTITLSSTLGPLVIRNNNVTNLTIDGPGANLLTID